MILMKTKIQVIFFICLSAAIHAQSTSYEKWSFATDGKVLSHPVVDENIVYFGSDDKSFYAVDIPSGKMQWQYKTRFRIRGKALVHNDCEAIVAVGTIISELPCVDQIDVTKIQTGMKISVDGENGTVKII